MFLRNPRSLVLAALLSLAAASTASAADWPARPIRIVVPYPVGGGTDLGARRVAPKLSEALKQAVYVENKTGAGGAIGVDTVVRCFLQ